MGDFLCSKISSFDLRRIQPTPKSSKIKVEIGFWLHSNKTSFDLDLYPCLGYAASTFDARHAAPRASGLACVSVRCAAARHERRAAVTLQSGAHRRPRSGCLVRGDVGRPAAPRPTPRASRRPTAPPGARRAPLLLDT